MFGDETSKIRPPAEPTSQTRQGKQSRYASGSAECLPCKIYARTIRVLLSRRELSRSPRAQRSKRIGYAAAVIHVDNAPFRLRRKLILFDLCRGLPTALGRVVAFRGGLLLTSTHQLRVVGGEVVFVVLTILI